MFYHITSHNVLVLQNDLLTYVSYSAISTVHVMKLFGCPRGSTELHLSGSLNMVQLALDICETQQFVIPVAHPL